MNRTRFFTILLGVTLVCSAALAQPNGPIPPLAPNLPGSETRLLPANVDVWACDWAPDGKALVFCGKIQGEDGSKMRIWHWPLDPIIDPSPLPIRDAFIDSSPRWSPDGSRLLTTRRSYGKTGAGTASAIWVREIPGGNPRQISLGPEDRDPFWSPDGARIVFSRGQGPYRGQLIILNTANGSSRVAAGQENELLGAPYWVKNGRIYFVKMTPAPREVEVNGQNYKVMEFGRAGIWSLSPEDGATQPVVVDDYDNRQPALSPDGTKLAFVSSRVVASDGNGKFDRGSLFIKNMATGEVYYITSKVGLNGGSLSWSPDSKRISFFTFRSIRPAVWIITLP
jgi:dipeptidyl aminopeptidase/acylaminoacyl peptidase